MATKKANPVKIDNSLAATYYGHYLDFHLTGPEAQRVEFYTAYKAVLNQKQYDDVVEKNSCPTEDRDRWQVFGKRAKEIFKLSQKARDLANKYGLTLHNLPKKIGRPG